MGQSSLLTNPLHRFFCCPHWMTLKRFSLTVIFFYLFCICMAMTEPEDDEGSLIDAQDRLYAHLFVRNLTENLFTMGYNVGLVELTEHRPLSDEDTGLTVRVHAVHSSNGAVFYHHKVLYKPKL